MRVLFLNNQGLASFGGGVSILRYLVAAYARDSEVTVLSYDPPGLAPDGVRQIQLPRPAVPAGPLWRVAPMLRARHVAQALPRTELDAADLIVCLDCHFALAVRHVPRARLVYLSLSCVPRQERAGGANALTFAQYAWLERHVARSARYVLAASRMHAHELRRWEGVRDAIVLHPILPGPPPLPRRPAPVPIVLAAGRLEPGKQFARVLDAAAALREAPCRFIIAGDGPERAALTGRSNALGLASRVTFTGAVPDLAPLLAEADILLHPSPYESFGMVVFEAMRAGVVPVGRRDALVGYAEIVTDGVDALLDPAGLRALVMDPAMRGRMAKAASDRAEQLLAGVSYADAFRQATSTAHSEPRRAGEPGGSNLPAAA